MTISYPDVLTALKMDSGVMMRRAFETMNIPEMVEVGTFIAPHRLAVVAPRGDWSLAPDSQDSKITTANLAEISRQAFNAPINDLPADVAAMIDPWRKQVIKTALVQLAQRRRVAPLLTMDTDVTGFLPTPTGIPASLSEADYIAAGRRNNIEVAAIKAVAIVESGGRQGFDDQGRPKILFEAHYFGPRTGNRFNATHPHLSTIKGNRKHSKLFYGWDQYQRLREAMVLDIDAALGSASWGKFQVMGANHSGWPDVRSFVTAMYESEATHLKSFEAYCTDANIMDKARRKDWKGFAEGYNGPRQQGYDTKMAAHYKQLGGR